VAGLSENQGCPARVPVILRDVRDIRDAFGVGGRTVKAWEDAGAPIIRLQSGDVRAELGEVWDWLKNQASNGWPDLPS
jgi:hypothetical protein